MNFITPFDVWRKPFKSMNTRLSKKFWDHREKYVFVIE